MSRKKRNKKNKGGSGSNASNQKSTKTIGGMRHEDDVGSVNDALVNEPVEKIAEEITVALLRELCANMDITVWAT